MAETKRAVIEDVLRSTYAGRVRGDVEATLAGFADDVIFEFNGRGTGRPDLGAPVVTKTALRPVMKGLIDDFRFSDWKEVALLIDGERALLHWRANVTFAGNGKSAVFDVFDSVTFRDGKIAIFRQSTDTAMVVAMVSG